MAGRWLKEWEEMSSQKMGVDVSTTPSIFIERFERAGCPGGWGGLCQPLSTPAISAWKLPF